MIPLGVSLNLNENLEKDKLKKDLEAQKMNFQQKERGSTLRSWQKVVKIVKRIGWTQKCNTSILEIENKNLHLAWDKENQAYSVHEGLFKLKGFFREGRKL